MFVVRGFSNWMSANDIDSTSQKEPTICEETENEKTIRSHGKLDEVSRHLTDATMKRSLEKQQGSNSSEVMMHSMVAQRNGLPMPTQSSRVPDAVFRTQSSTSVADAVQRHVMAQVSREPSSGSESGVSLSAYDTPPDQSPVHGVPPNVGPGDFSKIPSPLAGARTPAMTKRLQGHAPQQFSPITPETANDTPRVPGKWSGCAPNSSEPDDMAAVISMSDFIDEAMIISMSELGPSGVSPSKTSTKRKSHGESLPDQTASTPQASSRDDANGSAKESKLQTASEIAGFPSVNESMSTSRVSEDSITGDANHRRGSKRTKSKKNKVHATKEVPGNMVSAESTRQVSSIPRETRTEMQNVEIDSTAFELESHKLEAQKKNPKQNDSTDSERLAKATSAENSIVSSVAAIALEPCTALPPTHSVRMMEGLSDEDISREAGRELVKRSSGSKEVRRRSSKDKQTQANATSEGGEKQSRAGKKSDADKKRGKRRSKTGVESDATTATGEKPPVSKEPVERACRKSSSRDETNHELNEGVVVERSESSTTGEGESDPHDAEVPGANESSGRALSSGQVANMQSCENAVEEDCGRAGREGQDRAAETASLPIGEKEIATAFGIADPPRETGETDKPNGSSAVEREAPEEVWNPRESWAQQHPCAAQAVPLEEIVPIFPQRTKNEDALVCTDSDADMFALEPDESSPIGSEELATQRRKHGAPLNFSRIHDEKTPENLNYPPRLRSRDIGPISFNMDGYEASQSPTPNSDDLSRQERERAIRGIETPSLGKQFHEQYDSDSKDKTLSTSESTDVSHITDGCPGTTPKTSITHQSRFPSLRRLKSLDPKAVASFRNYSQDEALRRGDALSRMASAHVPTRSSASLDDGFEPFVLRRTSSKRRTPKLNARVRSLNSAQDSSLSGSYDAASPMTQQSYSEASPIPNPEGSPGTAKEDAWKVSSGPAKPNASVTAGRPPQPKRRLRLSKMLSKKEGSNFP